MTNFYKLSLLFVLTLISMGAWAQTPVYVNHAATGPTHNGESWATAYTDLQTAINAAGSGDEIWVAQGKYLPTSDPANRDATFQLKNGVRIYGGFSGNGTETAVNQRQWGADGNLTHKSILSGDIDGDDTGTDDIISDPVTQILGNNSYNVVTGSGVDNTAVLDGFTITGGSPAPTATISAGDRRQSGGGVYIMSGSPTLSNLIFSGNFARQGGAIYVGGVEASKSYLTITKSTFVHNVSRLQGAGIFGAAHAEVSIDAVTFEENKSIASESNGWGGAVRAQQNSIFKIENSIFHKNTAVSGAGIFFDSTPPTGFSHQILNTVFSFNIADGGNGSALTVNLSARARIVNSTFYGNHTTGAGAIRVTGTNANAQVFNSILFGNTTTGSPSDISHASGTLEVKNTITQTYTTGNDATNNVQVGINPLFSSIVDTDDEFLKLSAGSPAINAGDDNLYTDAGGDLSGSDLADNPRRVGDDIDLGPYEYQGTTTGGIQPDGNGILYVKKDAAGNGSGNNWTNALNELSDALIAADNADLGIQQIWVSAGTYHPQEDIQNRGSIYEGTDPVLSRYRTFILREGVKVYGGFAGTETDLEQRQWEADGITLTHKSILSGDFAGDDIVAPLDSDDAIVSISNNDENALHVVVSWDNSPATGLDGFTIRGGNAGLTGSAVTPATGFTFARSAGAGIFVNGSSPTLHNLILEHNRSAATGSNPAGAGIHMLNGKSNETISLDNVVVRENIGAARGAGLYIVGAEVVVKNSRFTGNKTTGQDGGAAYIGAGVEVKFEKPVFTNNVASAGSAGAIATLASDTNPSTVTIEDGIFTKNKALGDGVDGGVMRISTAITINVTNSVFSENTSVRRGGAIYALASGKVNISNSTFNKNEATGSSGSGGAIYFYGGTDGHEANLRNVVFYDNEAEVNGGALTFGNAFNNAIITNATFYQNRTTATSGTGGGAIRVASGDVKLYNSIFYDNTAFTGEDISNNGTLDIKNAITQTYSTTDDDANNIQVGVNPQFASDNPSDEDNFLHLAPGSPAIDAGDDDLYDGGPDNIMDDRAGLPRFVGTIDLGAYELNDGSITPGTNGILYVKEGGAGAMIGNNWANALPELSTALVAAEDAALGVQQIWVAAGTYYPQEILEDGTTSTTDRDKTFILREGVKVYGGFAGTEEATFDLDNRDFAANETTLSGNIDGTLDAVATDDDGTVTGITGNDDNVYHVVVSWNNSPETVLDGFTISGGNADQPTETVEPETGFSFTRGQGAGISTNKSSPTLRNLVVKHNYAGLTGNTSNTGSGIYIQEAKQNGSILDPIAISNVEVLENLGPARGAGLSVVGASGGIPVEVHVQNSRFSGNQGGRGGAVSAGDAVDLTIEGTDFTNNKGTTAGAVYALGSAGNVAKITITGGDFIKNETTSTTSGGGGVYADDYADVSITGTTFIENNATAGGGALHAFGSGARLTVTDSHFTGNEGTQGGAARISTSATVDIINSVFIDNTSRTSGGGALYMTGGSGTTRSNVTVKGSVFAGNKSLVGNGGAINKLSYSTLSITGTTIYGNSAETGQGGAIAVGGTISATRLILHNSIVYGNTADTGNGDITSSNSTNDEIRYSITQGYGAGAEGVQVITDPAQATLIFASTDPDEENFLHLSQDPNNPAVDEGNNTLYIGDLNNDFDLAGNSRLSGTAIDLGAFEYQGATTPIDPTAILYVKEGGAGNNTGENWDNALAGLAEALAIAGDPSTGVEEIWVAAGLYTPVNPDDPANVTETERMATFQLINDVEIYGGFAGNETAVDQREKEADGITLTHKSILSGDINRDDDVPVITDPAAQVNGSNSRNVVVGSGTNSSAVLDGFTITAGYSIEEIGGNTARERNGAGIYNSGGSPTLRNLVISGNLSQRNAGGIYNNGSSPEITDVVISHNVAHTNVGAGVTNLSSSHAVLRNVKITNNTAQASGGGVYNESSSAPTVIDTEISNNTSSANGGGIYHNSAGVLKLEGVKINGNTGNGTTGGGGLYVNNGSVSISGSEFIGNETNGYGGAILKVQNAAISDINHSKFIGNIARGTNGGGAIYLNWGNNGGAGINPVPISQSLFANNSSTNNGGAISMLNAGTVTLSGVTMYGNQAGGDGGAINAAGTTARTIAIHNSILYGNTSGSGTHDVTGPASATFDIKHSITQGAGTNGEDGVLHADPQFLSTNESSLEFLWLAPGSPAIGAGDNDRYEDLATLVDLAGNPRLAGDAVDLGAFEMTPRATPTFEVLWNGQPVPAGGIRLTPGEQGVLTVNTSSDGAVNITADALVDLSSDTSPSTVTAVSNGTGEITVDLAGTMDFEGVSRTIDVQVGRVAPTLEVRWNGNPIAEGNLQLTLGDEGVLTVVTNSDATAEITIDNSTLLSLSSNTAPVNITVLESGSGQLTVRLGETNSFEERVLTINVQVNKLAQQIRLYAPQGVMLSDGSIQLTEVSASSGLPVTLTVDDPSIATISGMELILHKRGTVRVTATQAGDASYAPAEPVTVEIIVISYEDAGLRVHPALSPNGDGVNDVLRIDGIEAYPRNTLVIFDQGGNIIAEIKDYDNQQNVFTGDHLRDGTYFYHLHYQRNSGRWHNLRGFFELKRN